MTKPEPAQSNHPADELGELRLQIYLLHQRAKRLRAEILSLPEQERRGIYWNPKVTDHTSTRFDRAGLVKEFGLLRLLPFMKEQSYQRVALVKIRNKKKEGA
jgi:hypothetical protein